MTDQTRNNAALEQQIKQRTEELQKLNQRLLTSNRELEQFAYVASHDLQEPLRKINAFGDMLISKLGDGVNSDGLDLIRRMQSASTRMKSLIDGLLSYSLISSTTTKPEIIDLSRTIAEVYEDVETSLKAKEGKIVTGELFPVIGDPLQLKQLFQNLVSNSLKFSKEGEAPLIQVSARLVKGSESGFNINEDDQDKQFQLIEVKDNGIGFEQEYANKIFQLFERLHGKGEYPGNGMGLSIVQKVVENHHGYIRAESQLHEGTTFQILLPATS
jgi:light-regulated signal transduction histidine kinase (bacteriophytochrome)